MDSEKLERMIDFPQEFGFTWLFSPVAKGIGDKAIELMPDAPSVQFAGGDLAKVRETFGDAFILGALDGQSPKVQAQRVVRDAVEDDTSLRKNRRELQRMVLRAHFGARAGRRATVIEKQVFIGLDGNKYDTLVEAQAASKAFLIDQQLQG